MLTEQSSSEIVRPTLDELRRLGTLFIGVGPGLALTHRPERDRIQRPPRGRPRDPGRAGRACSRPSPGPAAAATCCPGIERGAGPRGGGHGRGRGEGYGRAAHGEAGRGTRRGRRRRGVVRSARGPGARTRPWRPAGGRVLSVVGTGEGLAEARDRAYDAVSRIRLDGAVVRSDIAAAAVRRGPRPLTSGPPTRSPTPLREDGLRDRQALIPDVLAARYASPRRRCGRPEASRRAPRRSSTTLCSGDQSAAIPGEA